MNELSKNELMKVEGGIAPLILVCWGAMLVCDAITVGMWYGYNQNK